MLSTEQEGLLAQTGPSTPLGNLLRRYWLPFAIASELTDEQPLRAVRILSENLVLFRDTSGRAGLIQERCSHGGYPMVLGQVEATGIACARHDWHFDLEGNCSVVGYQHKIYPMAWARAQTYPVQQYAGIYWAYLGPQPAPALPKYDVLARRDGRRRITIYPACDGNWIAAGVGGMDPWLLQAAQELQVTAPLSQPGGGALWLRLPIDDTHTWRVAVEFVPTDEATPGDPHVEEPEVVYAGSAPSRRAAGDGLPVDGGTAMLAALLLREIERVEQGQDPLGLIRDPDHPMIRTGLL